MNSNINRSLNLARLKNMPKILEAKKRNVYQDFNNLRESMMSEYSANPNQAVEYVVKANYFANPFLNESEEFVPRFSLKKFSNPIFSKFEPNKEYPFSQDLMILAISYGFCLLLNYRGEKDDFTMGHSRIIYPVCIGKSASGKLLLRGYHLRGFSISKMSNVEKEWRLFRCDRILSMSFVGSFFRMAPAGYKKIDRGMVGGIIKSADFDEIRRNQLTLVQKQQIQRKSEIDLDQDGKSVPVVQIEETSSELDLRKPFDNVNLDEKNKSLIRITFLKSNSKNHYIALLGAYGKKSNQVRIVTEGKILGTYTVMRSVLGQHLGKTFYNNIDGQTTFDLYLFIKIVGANEPQPQNKTPKKEDKPEEEKKEEETKPEEDNVYRPGTGKEKDVYSPGDVIEWNLDKEKEDKKNKDKEPPTNIEPDDIYSSDNE